jgi:hypothetical protein
MAKIAWEDLPEWARTDIKKYSGGMAQIAKAGGSLSINGNTAYFNGQLVAEPGEVVDPNEKEETVRLLDLPGWAMVKVLTSGAGTQLNMNRGGDSLQIEGGIARFNGKRVEK